jgi:hypothetical protein
LDPAPHSTSETHSPQPPFSHTCPASQSVALQQLAATQPPLQQASPLAHWALPEQPWQELPTQAPPSAQSAELQQLPTVQAPPQHFDPVPHWASSVQAAHRPPWHSWPPVQSALLQQLPVWQSPAQQTAPASQSDAVLQPRQLPALQTTPASPQSEFWQQAAHDPPQHRSPVGHWPLAVHGPHWPATQTWAPQLAESWQLPGVQTPLTQIWLAAHCQSCEQGTHWFATQTAPPVQSGVVWQSPGVQLSFTQISPPGHSLSLVQPWH